ncbi:phage major tail tube protein [Providencia alcalifaciens]|uniref:Putative phage major tail tube protein n=1 Tax=Providencia alcalifaciens DSM 30120 TaxID=520999 RepID=B6XJL3_9GAMM|nr:phage major tail tube protein [Providencia alcalifaciens]ATG16345.1 phage tail protein [Providencia alcalifaciens]EEB44413.1 putative phage major tail tube protein [Providencia alcalifaciens DSM 30120]ETT05813.1 phage tail tube protein FII [Providencia alcalifaciens F90-2004]EUC96304.1 phage tail tube protein FII [Providencia alcalifaciens PAL-2]MTB33283.1 phage tail protein [Providencia alcalifaciens]
MSYHNQLRAWTFFRQGIRIQGAHEFMPPTLSIVKTDLRTGAQDAPTPVDDGMEALTCQIKFYGLDTEMLSSFGFVSGQRSRFSAYQGYVANNIALGTIEEIEGFVMTVTPDARGNSNLSEAAFTVDIAVNYYRKTFEGKELFMIDTERFVRRVNGVDMLAGVAAKVRV